MSLVYIPGMKNREERSKHFFDSGPLMEEDEDLAVYDKVTGFLKFKYEYRRDEEKSGCTLMMFDAGSSALCKF